MSYTEDGVCLILTFPDIRKLTVYATALALARIVMKPPMIILAYFRLVILRLSPPLLFLSISHVLFSPATLLLFTMC